MIILSLYISSSNICSTISNLQKVGKYIGMHLISKKAFTGFINYLLDITGIIIIRVNSTFEFQPKYIGIQNHVQLWPLIRCLLVFICPTKAVQEFDKNSFTILKTGLLRKLEHVSNKKCN